MKHRSFPALLLLALLLVPGCIIIDDDVIDHNDVVVSESFSYTVPVANRVRLQLEAINGTITLTGSAGTSSVIVSGVRKVGSDSRRDAERHLDDLRVEVIEGSDDVYVRTVQPSQSHGRNYTVDYTLSLPGYLDVEVEHVNGNVAMSGLNRDIRVSLVNGNIDCYAAHPPGGDVILTLVNGNIGLNLPVGTSADLSALVTNGHVTTSNLNLHDPVITTRSLTGRLGDGDEEIKLTVVNGNITVRGN